MAGQRLSAIERHIREILGPATASGETDGHLLERFTRHNDPTAFEVMVQRHGPMVLDEVNRLPEKYRGPVVLCYLEGKTNEEAARQLHWPAGTVKTRLARARSLLQTRLIRRGCTLSAAGLAMVLEESPAYAAVPGSLVASTVKNATFLVAGETSLAGGLSGQVAALMEGMVRAMFVARVKLAAAVLLAVVVAAGAVFAIRQAVAAKHGDETLLEQPLAEGREDPPEKPEGKKLTRTDMYGDPLPSGALARLGSLQLRHYGWPSLAFSTDGKFLISAGTDHLVRFWDLATGKLVRTTKLQGAASLEYSFLLLSPGGKFVVRSDDKELVFWDGESGKELKKLPVPQSTSRFFWGMSFSPDGQTLAVGFDESDVLKMTLWNWKEGKERQITLPSAEDIAGRGRDSSRHTCFSPDGKLLATGSWSVDPLCIWDVATGRELHRFNANASVSAFSPDSKILAAASMQHDGTELKTTLRIYDVATGKEVQQIPLHSKGFYWGITFSPDGKVIGLVDTLGVSLLDHGTGKELHRLAGMKMGRQRRALFSPDGRILAGAGGNRIHLWDVATGKELHEQPNKGNDVNCAAYTPDGRFLATGDSTGVSVDLWDMVKGEHGRVLDMEQFAFNSNLSVTADGKTLLALRGQGEGNIAFMDLTTGKLRRTLSINSAQQPEKHDVKFFHLLPDGRRAITLGRSFSQSQKEHLEVCIWEIEPVKLVARQTFPSAPERGWAPLGNQVAFLMADGIVTADGNTGQFRLRVPGAWDGPLIASPKHKLLAALRRGLPQGQGPHQRRDALAVHVWEAATGKEVLTIAAGAVEFMALAPDGRTLVTVDAKSLRLWDLATGKERHCIAFPEDFPHFPLSPGYGFIRGLYLAPDGRRATTALGDGTLLVWELPPLSRSGNLGVDLSDAKEMERLWTDLAGEDAARAYSAIWKLTDAPKKGVALFKRNLKPAVDADIKKAVQLIQDLDSDVFSTRETAGEELKKMGRSVVPALRRALADSPSLDVRRRLEMILTAISNSVPTPEVLRNLRAIQVLEQIGSREAREVLETLAKGIPEALETQEAKASLDRLGK